MAVQLVRRQASVYRAVGPPETKQDKPLGLFVPPVNHIVPSALLLYMRLKPTTDPSRRLHIDLFDGLATDMLGAVICIFHDANQVCFGCLLERLPRRVTPSAPRSAVIAWATSRTWHSVGESVGQVCGVVCAYADGPGGRRAACGGRVWSSFGCFDVPDCNGTRLATLDRRPRRGFASCANCASAIRRAGWVFGGGGGGGVLDGEQRETDDQPTKHAREKTATLVVAIRPDYLMEQTSKGQRLPTDVVLFCFHPTAPPSRLDPHRRMSPFHLSISSSFRHRLSLLLVVFCSS
ncbi:hypothetical protein IWX90DRAFT_89193 [Phyllosticta citrichinensis]|uniref:Uncharacterized protein n=1 Tax=Phyllosticta citrichinensis TaxID=1130410 RepID=A0ABR1XFJ4_9PEZI